MTISPSAHWIQQFGLQDRKPPDFFSGQEQLDDVTANVPQPHALRRAFEQLRIDGVLCQERSPVIYFREVKQIDLEEIVALHRSFWNQGVAPILVIIAPDEVHIYSGLVHPADVPAAGGRAPGFVETLQRVQEQLRSFILSVESGEYFNVHRPSFDPSKRVDRDLLQNLQATRHELGQVQTSRLEPQVLDALLCRLVFTCYLFDRGVIDRDYLKTLRIHGSDHLRDILAKSPRTDAKSDLYKLFSQLGADFNGDLFSDDLDAESRQIRVDHLEIIDAFFHGTDVRSGQQAFWPYDFGIIPIETISAIYEHFLKAAGVEEKKEAGAFYTPRFLAEFVLDVTLEGERSLLDKKFLDPACGSGIFLVGLFNRLAEEWKLANPGARYDRRANGLMAVLRNNLYGIDRNRSACQITAFSLYLAFLDQLSPPDIQRLLGKWDRLPNLVSVPGDETGTSHSGTIRCADFFTDAAEPPQRFDFVIGNPPWGSDKDRRSPAAQWCGTRNLPHPDRQLATAFIWKAPYHLAETGRVCFVLPHGVLFNHNDTAIRFQQSWFRTHAVDRLINLTDYQFFLFEESRAPAIVAKYRQTRPADSSHGIEYWAPKANWTVTQAEIIDILPQDRWHLTVREVLEDLQGEDAPQIWKARVWATPRDWRLINRLSLYERLRDNVRQTKERASTKPWLIAQGFQPLGPGDSTDDAKQLTLPTRRYIDAADIKLLLVPDDCQTLPSATTQVRGRSGVNTAVFKPPHIVITGGFSQCAFTDLPLTFRSSVRGISGPKADRDLLIFLSFYLQSDLARYFLFHTSSNWGVSRARVLDQELLRLPFPFPEQCEEPVTAKRIIKEVADLYDKTLARAANDFNDRNDITRDALHLSRRLIEEYFDIDDVERMLVADTVNVSIPSFRPSRTKLNVPTLSSSTHADRAAYMRLLCETLNGWASNEFRVEGLALFDATIGAGMVVLEKTRRGQQADQLNKIDTGFLSVLDQLQRSSTKSHGTFELLRGLKVFHKNLLFVTKPLGRRFWTNTAALNDADEIAATILMRAGKGAK